MGWSLIRAELLGPVETVAPRLLGWSIETAEVAIRLTEVEAYGGVGADAASHAHRGPTPRTQVMFGPQGIAYVYFSYGMHWCLNVVTGQTGHASAVLLRAGEVISGIEVARARRPAARSNSELARGPARLCAALGLDGGATGLDLLDPSSPVRLIPAELLAEQSVASGPRVGVSQAARVPWRFWLEGEATVSHYRSNPRLAPQ